MFSKLPVDGRAPAGRAGRFTIPATVEQMLLAASVFWALAANVSFLSAALDGRERSAPATWGFALALLVLLGAVHFLLLALVANRWTVKPVLAVLAIATAAATYYMSQYGVYLDPSMLRNVLRTDPAEARELLAPALWLQLLLYAGLPIALLTRVRVVNRPWPRATLVRIGVIVAALAVAAGALLSVFQPMASLMRNHREVRYLITPANLVWSTGAVAMADARGAAAPRQAIGLDAKPGPLWAQRTRPQLVVLVVGETVRAMNWGLNGYARQTTPELAALPVINFTDVTACGTNTEVSLPCMFAPVGRRDYDESRIRGSEGLLQVLARAGVAVHWRDNQSGCKGVCDGVPNDSVKALELPGLCADGRCLDEGLGADLEQRLANAQGMQLLVLHQLGNHGPSYFRRYPKAFARFVPACEHDDLQRCSREEIVNAYDNVLLYTDHVLAQLLRKLMASESRVDTALVYVSDHGESLGEKGLFLHGMPYAIAPDEQTKVPMLMWLSAGLQQSLGIDAGCLRQRAAKPAAHDHLFHTLLALLDVRTALYAADWDLTRDCRRAPATKP
ncbi:MAG: phosphoethanolamine--lipid A transferase [Burkholderiaceae bacterium]